MRHAILHVNKRFSGIDGILSTFTGMLSTFVGIVPTALGSDGRGIGLQ